ncbi:MAG: hypothetical protein M0R49_01175 [Limnochordia bacterium]|nr:hypothetical protein [Limnochordia bacterium]
MKAIDAGRQIACPNQGKFIHLISPKVQIKYTCIKQEGDRIFSDPCTKADMEKCQHYKPEPCKFKAGDRVVVVDEEGAKSVWAAVKGGDVGVVSAVFRYAVKWRVSVRFPSDTWELYESHLDFAPPEPVKKWQWIFKAGNVYGLTSPHFSTKADAQLYMGTYTIIEPYLPSERICK